MRNAAKQKLSDLAIFGGKPTFKEKLHVGCPNIGNHKQFFKRINDILDKRRLTHNGPYVIELERKIASLIGVKHCIVTCNGTLALEIAIRSLGLEGEVIVPSFTYVATAHAALWQNIIPVFCDIHPETYTINSEKIEDLITPRTTGIIGVHLWGRPCMIESLGDIASRRGLKLLFDAAHAFGCSYRGRMVGSFGNAEVFSFHATKIINAFEGGAVVTNDDDLAGRIRLMKNFGFAGYDNVICLGTNAKMTEVSAAMGLTNLQSFDTFIAINHRNYKEYLRQLKDINGLSLLLYNEEEKNNFQYIILKINETEAHLSRDELITILHAENVLARRYFYPGCHRLEPYRSIFPNAGTILPETQKLAQQVVALPTGTSVIPVDIKKICEIIRFAVSHSSDIKAKLSQSSFKTKA